MTTPLEAAIYYATQKQWKVFPLIHNDKRPLFPAAHEPGNPCRGECGKVGHGFHDAVTDAFTVSEWWSRYPDAGIGIATGKQSGIVAIDIDPKHNGEESLKQILTERGDFPITPIAQTGGGGRHIVFAHPQAVEIRNSAGRLGQGIDARGDGGYIAAAPSGHPSGHHYKWINPPSTTPLAKMPDWLIHALIDEQPTTRTVGAPAEGIFPSGSRNDNLTRMAGLLQRKNYSASAIYNAISAENAARCVPPLPDAEIKAIVASVSRYTPAEPIPLVNRDRAAAEWGFIKAMYEYPETDDFERITPDMFGDERLGIFWEDVRGGRSTTDAAVSAGILADLDKIDGASLARISDFAKQIEHFSRMTTFRRFGSRLIKAADEGDAQKLEKVVSDLNKNTETKATRAVCVSDAAEELEKEVRLRELHPTDIWGIPYAWNYLSFQTGGKQKGELTISAGEPGVGKSWFWHQDALETAIKGTSTLIWSGEMKSIQMMRRLYQIYGVNRDAMLTGRMTPEDWGVLNDAKAVILNSPLFLDDRPLSVSEIRPMLRGLKDKEGLSGAVFDYASLIKAPGRDEIEQSANVSRELKICASELDIAITLITSVNKSGMDTTSDNVTKSNVRGSGQQIHDADNVFIITKYNPSIDKKCLVRPEDYEKAIMLHFGKGRELKSAIPGGFIVYRRMTPSPKFIELSK